MLVVGEQDHVDRSEFGGVDGGGRGLGEDVAVTPGVLTGGVEGGVGKEPQPAVLDEGGRTAEDADGVCSVCVLVIISSRMGRRFPVRRS